MKRILVIAVLVLSLLLVPSTASAAGIEVVGKTGGGWTDNTWKVGLYAGESKSTTLTLHNSSGVSLEVWVTITPDPLVGNNITFELKDANPIMLAGSNADVILTAKASGSATPGTYTAELEIKSEIAPTPVPSGGGGGGDDIPLYSIKTNLFGVEKTYYTEHNGDIYGDIKGTSEDGRLTITVPRYTTALEQDGKRLKTLEVISNPNPPYPPQDARIIGLAYLFSPDGATFEPPITFTWSYDPDALPEGVAEEDLVLAYYIDGEWIELESVVDTESNTITAYVKHFTTIAIIGTVIIPEPAPVVPVVEEPEPLPVPPPAPTRLAPVPGLAPIPAPAPMPAPEPPPKVVPTEVLPPPEAPSPWVLVIGIILSTVLVGLVVWFGVRRHRKARGVTIH